MNTELMALQLCSLLLEVFGPNTRYNYIWSFSTFDILVYIPNSYSLDGTTCKNVTNVTCHL